LDRTVAVDILLLLHYHPSGKFDDDGNMICPPMAFGGCGDGLLDLRCIFPYSWTRELEISAEKMVCSFDFSESLDGSSSCSLCKGMDDKADASCCKE
ncbi:hypothetical protein U1Q18_031129, partial [Sarracenia purpurea var. burkii]